MSNEAQVPIIPVIVWGAHRRLTKGHPRTLGRVKIPITVKVGKPLPPAATVEATEAAMRESMTTVLHDVQESYAHPEGAYWVPRRMGGSAPTMAEAKVLDEAELAERARKQAEREARR
jgi:1-acyl-sn-glycerol-3-phosphate acyltransferase